jgi:hypothetical protein
MAQANVYTSASAQAWYTDKAKITTGANTVTYQVNLVYPDGAGNLYSSPVQVSSNSSEEIFVGVGNQLTVAGGNVTIMELGTASSGSRAVRDTGGTLPF